MIIRRVIAFPILIAAFYFNGCGSDTSPSDHDGERSSSSDVGHNDAHEQAAGDEHGGDLIVLTSEQLERAGVRIEPLKGGTIATHITLPAEVGLNQDAVVHVIPRVPGIVVEVLGYLGQSVKKGDLLAVLESPELGETKIAYLQAIQSKAIADAELTRQRTISENTATLLEILREEPALDQLRDRSAGLRIGVNKGRLLAAYARVKAANANFTRERELRDSGLSTQADLLAAQEAFSSSQAEYFAAFEDIDFTYLLRLQEAERSAHVAASEVENSERRLHLLGLSEDQVSRVSEEPDTDVARYVMTAPSDGRIVSKHITPGEVVGTESPVHTIADLSTVWLNISVYTQYAGDVTEGQEVLVQVGDRSAIGVVEYISAVVSEATRTISARVVLSNPNGQWKPGEFVMARVETSQVSVERVVPIDAVQTVEGEDVIFVQDEDGIEPVRVRLGRRNDITIELMGNDIPIGTPIIVKNSFLMKAELGKGAASHDH